MTDIFYKLSKGLYYLVQKKKAERRFPFLRNYDQKFKKVAPTIKKEYEIYIRDISTPEMAISFRTAVFLLLFCEGLKPKSILDLGSGFSSFVLRSYASVKHHVNILSVDDSREWLRHTQKFLVRFNLSTDRLILWEDFEKLPHVSYDFIFYDLGRMDLRKKSLNIVLKIGKGGIIVLDDMHKATYAEYVHNHLSHYSYLYLDLQAFTLDKFGRYSSLLSDL